MPTSQRISSAAYAAETGFLVARAPDTVLAPDVGFVRKDRLPTRQPRGYFVGPPDVGYQRLRRVPGRAARDDLDRADRVAAGVSWCMW